MMTGFGMGFGGFGFLFMAIFWLGIIAAAIWLLGNLFPKNNVTDTTGGNGETAVSILATDYNQTTLDQAHPKPLNWQKIRLKTADAYNLDALSETFDAAYAVAWFAHVPRSRIDEFLGSLHRQLAVGATVAFVDQLPGARSQTANFDDEGNHLQTRTLPDGSNYRVIKHFMSDDELHNIFARYSHKVTIDRFPAVRRIVVSYTL